MLRAALFSTVVGAGLVLGLAACTNESMQGIPASATLVTGGSDRLSYRAPADGTVYIYDRDSPRLVYSGEVHRDQLVEVRPGDGRVLLDGRTVTERGLSSGNHYEMYFESGGRH